VTTNPIAVVSYMTIQPGTEQTFLDQFGELVAQTRAEQGCIDYAFHQHPKDSYRFFFYESFVDQAAFDFHLNQPYTQAWVALANAHGARFDVETWTMLSRRDRTR